MAAEKPAKAAPAVAFTDAAGARHALAAYKGHYVLLNMWATWCAPCVAELPALTRLKASVPGLTVLAVNMDKGQVDAAGFLKSHNAASLGSLRDTDITLMRGFGAFGLPTTVLIDPKGNVVGRAEGPATGIRLTRSPTSRASAADKLMLPGMLRPRAKRDERL